MAPVILYMYSTDLPGITCSKLCDYRSGASFTDLCWCWEPEGKKPGSREGLAGSGGLVESGVG